MIPYIGDFIAIIGLFKDVGVALKESGGAADDYQHIVRELESIVAVLQAVQSVPNTSSDVSQVNAIRSQAQSSQQLLAAFLKRIQKYDASLGAGARRGFRHGTVSKVRWATTVSKEISKLRQEIDVSTLGLRLLQNVHNA
jgi:hypothetical protein